MSRSLVDSLRRAMRGWYSGELYQALRDGSKHCIALIALGEEPPSLYIIHHARWLVHHCLSVDSRCLRKEGGRISRTAWPNWATWPCRPPQVERSFVSSMENAARPARLRARLTNVSSIRL